MTRSLPFCQAYSISFDSVLLKSLFFFFFFNDTATTEIYTLSLHDALPIAPPVGGKHARELLCDRRRVEDLGKGGEPRIDDGSRWHGPRLRPRGREGPPRAPPQPCRPIREPVYARRVSHAPARWRPDGRPDAAPDPTAPTPDRPPERPRPAHPTPPSTHGTAQPAAAARQ